MSKRVSSLDHREHWHWGVGILPLTSIDTPTGDAWSFEAALQAFKAAFLEWHAGIDPAVWERNRDYIKATDWW